MKPSFVGVLIAPTSELHLLALKGDGAGSEYIIMLLSQLPNGWVLTSVLTWYCFVLAMFTGEHGCWAICTGGDPGLGEVDGIEHLSVVRLVERVR
uniref:Uncharacterized protein n=1 Tax=Ciona intestinalis TaxID=7719 RepID=H2XR73_CIOIN